MLNAKKALTQLMKTPMVVESGTGSGAVYRKWSDGTMEVWKSWTGTSTFTSGRTSVTLVLPVSFIETPHMVASVIGDTSVYWSAVIDCRYISGNSIQVIADRVKDSINGSYKIGISLYAYGKWK